MYAREKVKAIRSTGNNLKADKVILQCLPENSIVIAVLQLKRHLRTWLQILCEAIFAKSCYKAVEVYSYHW